LSRRWTLLAAISSGAFLIVSPAQAASTDFPLLIRSLSAGSVPQPAAEYVMLQMTVDGQQDLTGLTLSFYGPDGAPTGSFSPQADVAHGEAQRSVLFATPAAASQGLDPDFLLDTGDALDRAAGAVCAAGPYPADCATWGLFPALAAALLPDPQSHNAPPILTTTLARVIEPGCSTWLGPDDDRGASSVDFFDGVPAVITKPEPSPPPPVNNAQSVDATPCPLDTGFDRAPSNPTNDPSPTFAYGETPSEYGAGFRCRLDGQPFSACPASGIGYGPLRDGVHRFEVFAGGYAGPDLSPSSWEWVVDTVPPDTAIDSVPPEPSSGFSASFGFHSSEQDAGFQCQLDAAQPQACGPGKTYFILPDGTHVFRVWSSDQATNSDPSPATHVFNVDTRIGDRTPPNTKITSAPPGTSTSPAAGFTYVSSEAGSSFQCSLDDRPMTACPASGTGYGRRKNGRHVFRVRAVDRAGNADPAPATYAWNIRAPLPETLLTRVPRGITYLRGKEKKATVSFGFGAGEPRARFRCRVDKRPFARCTSPRRLELAPGRHIFEVVAMDAVGNLDRSSARWIFRVADRATRNPF